MSDNEEVYYVRIGGAPTGPFPRREIDEKLQNGEIKKNAAVSLDSLHWQSVEDMLSGRPVADSQKIDKAAAEAVKSSSSVRTSAVIKKYTSRAKTVDDGKPTAKLQKDKSGHFARCPECGEEVDANTSMVGKLLSCPGCTIEFRIGKPSVSRTRGKKKNTIVNMIIVVAVVCGAVLAIIHLGFSRSPPGQIVKYYYKEFVSGTINPGDLRRISSSSMKKSYERDLEMLGELYLELESIDPNRAKTRAKNKDALIKGIENLNQYRNCLDYLYRTLINLNRDSSYPNKEKLTEWMSFSNPKSTEIKNFAGKMTIIETNVTGDNATVITETVKDRLKLKWEMVYENGHWLINKFPPEIAPYTEFRYK